MTSRKIMTKKPLKAYEFEVKMSKNDNQRKT